MYDSRGRKGVTLLVGKLHDLHDLSFSRNMDQAYRDEIYSLQIQLSRTQVGPGRAVKEQQGQNSPNHLQRINLISVHVVDFAVQPVHHNKYGCTDWF